MLAKGFLTGLAVSSLAILAAPVQPTRDGVALGYSRNF
jgi:hypothetical protein